MMTATPIFLSYINPICPSFFIKSIFLKIFTLFLQGECQRDEECADTEACEDYYCVNVCKAETCQKDLFCKAIRHVPVCGRNYVPEPQEVRIFY